MIYPLPRGCAVLAAELEQVFSGSGGGGGGGGPRDPDNSLTSVICSESSTSAVVGLDEADFSKHKVANTCLWW